MHTGSASFLTLCSLFACANAGSPSQYSTAELTLAQTQSLWVESFNKGEFDKCADLYTETAHFVLLKDDMKHDIRNGREAIRAFWKTAVEELKFKNLQAWGPTTQYLKKEQVAQSYKKATFDSEDAKPALTVEILLEEWVKTKHGWRVENDIVRVIPNENPEMLFLNHF